MIGCVINCECYTCHHKRESHAQDNPRPNCVVCILEFILPDVLGKLAKARQVTDEQLNRRITI